MAVAILVIRHSPIVQLAILMCVRRASLAIISPVTADLASVALVTAPVAVTPRAVALQLLISLAPVAPVLFPTALYVMHIRALLVYRDIGFAMASAHLVPLVPMEFKLPAQSQQTLSAELHALQAAPPIVRHVIMVHALSAIADTICTTVNAVHARLALLAPP
jgi:hypothetical protein